MNYDVIVIGAGLSGLSAAYHLQKTDKKVKVLELEQEVGGRTRTLKLADGSMHAIGTEFFTPKYKNIMRLCSELGIPLRSVKQLYTIKFNGNNWEFGYTRVLKWIKTIGIRHIIIQVFNLPHILRVYFMNSFNLKGLLQLESVDIGTFLRQINSPKELTELIAAVNRLTFHYSDGLEEINAAFLINWVKHISSGVYLLPTNGINSFAEALARNLDVECGFEAKSIERVNKTWIVSNGQKSYKANSLIVALPADLSYELLKGTDLDEDLLDFLGQTRYSKLRKYYVQTEQGKIIPGTVIVQPPQSEFVEFYSQISPTLGVAKIRPEYFDTDISLDVVTKDLAVMSPMLVKDVKMSHALPVYNTEHIERTLTYLDKSKEIARKDNIILSGDYIFGPYTESAVYSGIKAAEVHSEAMREAKQ